MGSMDDPRFRSDLYRGTASYYDRFRVPYPPGLLADLTHRSGARGEGSLLDLGCGPGLISFAMHDQFSDIWAVDQEPGMIDVARQKAKTAGITNIRFLTSAAEDLSVPGESFDLVAIGNAFHRMPRADVAARVLRWLRPGQFLALLWSGTPWEGQAPWQLAMSATMVRWRTRAGADDRIPPRYDEIRRQRPDSGILRDAGFQLAGSYQFPVSWDWTPEALIGFAYSTSVLSRAALGGLAAGFEQDLRQEVCAAEPSGVLRQTIRFGYELARRPALCGVNHLRAGTSAGVPGRLVEGPGSFGMIWHLAGPGHASPGPDRDRIPVTARA
jgi:SAM-dependent methyltransferase